jgi:adenylate cyclase
MQSKFKDMFLEASLDVSRELNKSSEKKSRVFANEGNRTLRKSINTQVGTESLLESILTDESAFALSITESNVKSQLRPAFGKSGPVNEGIGTHPDFQHLSGTAELENGYAVTMFFDIAGSTKLGKTYPPEIVFNIKNTIIKYVIEIIQAFDGHVHRIMGDAVMAFFRSKNKVPEGREIDSAIDSLNAGVYIIEFMKQVITPALGDITAEKPIGIRLGIDYAKDKDIIWGNYGASGAFEVTATSYHVDVAAKLQQAAKTNKIMVGENFKNLIGLGNEYLSIPFKEITRDDRVEKIDRKYVTPNYRVKGELINYRQYELDNSKYFGFLPYGLNNTDIEVELVVSNQHTTLTHRNPCALSLDRGMSLIFKVKYHKIASKIFTLVSEKQNTGDEALSHNALDLQIKSSSMAYQNGYYYGEVSESTSYHGLHHMRLKIKDSDQRTVDETIFSIFIKPR